MSSPSIPLYVQDVLSQPDTLREGLRRASESNLAHAASLVRGAERIVLTGMGASHAALLPAWRALIEAGHTAWLMDTAELLSMEAALVTGRSVVIAASQSGRSAELVTLAGRLQPRGVPLIALTNDSSSPLASAARAVIDIHAGTEHAVSTRSYVNTLAMAGLLAAAITGRERPDWEGAADEMSSYLEHWREHVAELRSWIGSTERLVLLARGPSLAAALYGGLIIKEAAKWPAEAMNAAQFRHGPLELADERFAALVLAGEDHVTRERNARLARDINRYGGTALWVDSQPIPQLQLLRVPQRAGLAHGAIEALPMQLLSIALAEQTGIEPGVFRHLGKVTLVE